jgi:hypothetical protein
MGMGKDAMNVDLEYRIQQLIPRFLDAIKCRACWMELPLTISGSAIDMDLMSVDSENLTTNLIGCDKVIAFAATIGGEADRLCRSASFHAPFNALVYDAMGSTAIEWLCDALCKELSFLYPTHRLRPRFSPGYGDLPLSFQRELLRMLDAQRSIGLTLSESLMMIPQKSVTAFVGLRPNY